MGVLKQVDQGKNHVGPRVRRKVRSKPRQPPTPNDFRDHVGPPGRETEAGRETLRGIGPVLTVPAGRCLLVSSQTAG